MSYIDRGLVAPTLNDTSAAAANTTKIQAALTLGGLVQLIGLGTVWINATLVIPSNTKLIVQPGMTIKKVSGAANNLLVNTAYQVAGTSVTLTWSSSTPLQASVAWTAHGKTVGQSVQVDGTSGTTDSAYSGVFPIISVTDANNFVVQLRRTPGAAPSGTITAKQADTNIEVIGGTWDYNYPANSPGSNGPSQFAMIFCGVSNLRVRDVIGNAAPKYLVCTAATNEFQIENITGGPGHGSDIVKVYGPAWDGSVRGVHGMCGDDFVSLQPFEGVSFAAYNMTVGGGDVIDVVVDQVDAETSSVGALAIYATNAHQIDNIVIRRIAAYSGSSPMMKIASAIGSATVKRIKFEDCELRDDITKNALDIGVNVTIDLLEATGIEAPEILATNGFALVNLTGATVKNLVCSKLRGGRGTGGTLIYLGSGSVYDASLTDSYYNGNGSGAAVTINGATVRKVMLANNTLDAVLQGVLLSSAGNTPDIVLRDNQFYFSTRGVDANASCNIFVSGNSCQGGITAFVRANGAITVAIDSAGGNTGITAGQWLTKAAGTETINLRGFDFKVDVTTLARLDGGYCYNTNAAAGTLAAAGLVSCQGTAANSWRLMGDPTKQY